MPFHKYGSATINNEKENASESASRKG